MELCVPLYNYIHLYIVYFNLDNALDLYVEFYRFLLISAFLQIA